tara:strand:+ start:780 stop:1799 length:1020 start_codon:yes stop_codon:yes gene_type:complete
LDVLVLTSRPEKPSYRYRVEALLPGLADRGINVRVLFTRDMGRWRFRRYFDCSKYDSVLIQKRILRPVDRFLLRRVARRVIFDFDDAVGFDSEGKPRSRMQKRLAAMAHFADHITCGNNYLASLVATHDKKVTVVPTSIDTDRFAPAKEKESMVDSSTRVVVGWIGSQKNLKHLDEVLPVLASVDGIVLKVVADSVESLDLDRLGETPFEFENWSAETEVAQTASFDIGIMPLLDNNFTRGKCGCKALQCMSMGLPTICSPVGMNCDLIQPGINGLLAESPGEWGRSLNQLVGDVARRRKIGEQARAHVLNRYSAAAAVEQMAGVFERAAGSARRSTAA